MGVDSTPISREKQGTQSEALSQFWAFGDSGWEKRFFCPSRTGTEDDGSGGGGAVLLWTHSLLGEWNPWIQSSLKPDSFWIFFGHI